MTDPSNPTTTYFTPPADTPLRSAQAEGMTHPELAPPPASAAPAKQPLFSLDDLENEKTGEPFVFEYQGRTFELFDPKDLDWQDVLIAQENPRLMLHIIMPEDQREEFLQRKLPMRKLEALLKRWQTHFNLTTPGEAEGSARS